MEAREVQFSLTREDQGEAELTLTGVRGLRITRLTVEKVLRFVMGLDDPI